MSGFYACERGFRVTFANGYAVSVQWNFGNYSDNFTDHYVGTREEQDAVPKASANAECAVLYGKEFVGDVIGWQTPDQVAKLIARTAKRKPRAVSC